MMPDACDNCNCGPALSYLGAGLSVIPIRPDGSKAPMLPAWESFKTRLPTEVEVRGWFDRTQTPGVGIVGGNVSGGLLVLDFEFLDFFEEWLALVDAQAPGLAARLPLVRTPGKDDAGGRHVYARTAGPTVPTGKLARITRDEAERRTGDPGRITAVEVKAEKGYVLTVGCPAACHPTGRLYEHIAGPAIEDTPTLTAAEVDLLLTCARALERGDRASADPPWPKAQGSDLRPGDRFNRDADWFADVLGDGWKKVRDNGQVIYLCRPGKSEGVSATIGYCRTELAGPKLYVFSTNATPFEAERSYSKFDAYTVLRHGGDFAAAARELAQRGYGDGRKVRTGVRSSAAADQPDDQPTTLEIIVEYWREKYRPRFRRGEVVFSESLGRDVRKGEACCGAGSDLLKRMEEASNPPRDRKGNPDFDLLPRHFQTWCGSAWADFRDALPEEHQGAEILAAAKEDFRRAVCRGLLSMQAIGFREMVDGQEVTRSERRTLLSWCRMFAKKGPWASVRSFTLWCRLDDDGRLQIALRGDLFGMSGVGPPEIARYRHGEFADLCELYDVGQRSKAGGERVVELSPDFIAEAMVGPGGRVDGGLAGAPAKTSAQASTEQLTHDVSQT